MDTIKFDHNSTLMIAHRGASGLEPENTAAAFVAAGNRSYYGIESDVHKTRDGKYIIIHDDDTARVAADRLVVENSRLDELRSLTLLNKTGVKDRADLVFPTLEEYISICKWYGKFAVLELKNAMPPESVREIAVLIEQMNYLGSVIFISFSLDNLIALRRFYPEQPSQFLAESGFLNEHTTQQVIDLLKKYHLDLDAEYSAVTSESVKRFHDAGIKVNVWAPDQLGEGERLVGFGVDYITSNILE